MKKAHGENYKTVRIFFSTVEQKMVDNKLKLKGFRKFFWFFFLSSENKNDIEELSYCDGNIFSGFLCFIKQT